MRGLESTGLVATLKHFAGYSRLRRGPQPRAGLDGAAQAARRDAAPVRDGDPRGRRPLGHELLHARSTACRSAADPALLTGVLRDEWGFEGTVVARLLGDRLPADHAPRRGRRRARRARSRSRRGSTSSCRTSRCYGEPLAEAVRAGAVPEALVDRAARRVLRQKGELGLLDAGWSPESPPATGALDIDPPEHRALARELAEALDRAAGQRRDAAAARRRAAWRSSARARTTRSRSSAATRSPTTASWPGTRTWGSASRCRRCSTRSRELPERRAYAPGCDVHGRPTASGIAAAVEAAARGRRVRRGRRRPAGLFGRGTSGEGCDAEDLSLPGHPGRAGRGAAGDRHAGRARRRLRAAVRARALRGPARRRSSRRSSRARRAAAALAGVLTGARRARPAGCPCRCRAAPGAQPSTYLHPPLGGNSGEVSNLDPTPLFPFGHGLSYTTFEYDGLRAGAPTEIADRRRGRGVVRRAQRGRARGRRGRPALPARPGRAGHPARDPARGLPPRRARAGRAARA